MAVIAHADERAAACVNFQMDFGGACIECVLEQFAHDGGGPLDDFSCGDFFSGVRGQPVDRFVGRFMHRKTLARA